MAGVLLGWNVEYSRYRIPGAVYGNDRRYCGGVPAFCCSVGDYCCEAMPSILCVTLCQIEDVGGAPYSRWNGRVIQLHFTPREPLNYDHWISDRINLREIFPDYTTYPYNADWIRIQFQCPNQPFNLVFHGIQVLTSLNEFFDETFFEPPGISGMGPDSATGSPLLSCQPFLWARYGDILFSSNRWGIQVAATCGPPFFCVDQPTGTGSGPVIEDALLDLRTITLPAGCGWVTAEAQCVVKDDCCMEPTGTGHPECCPDLVSPLHATLVGEPGCECIDSEGGVGPIPLVFSNGVDPNGSWNNCSGTDWQLILRCVDPSAGADGYVLDVNVNLSPFQVGLTPEAGGSCSPLSLTFISPAPSPQTMMVEPMPFADPEPATGSAGGPIGGGCNAPFTVTITE